MKITLCELQSFFLCMGPYGPFDSGKSDITLESKFELQEESIQVILIKTGGAKRYMNDKAKTQWEVI